MLGHRRVPHAACGMHLCQDCRLLLQRAAAADELAAIANAAENMASVKSQLRRQQINCIPGAAAAAEASLRAAAAKQWDKRQRPVVK